MTAIVGVLNKEAVAIAADSAVTINCPSGHKVLNTANKIFQVSRKHPVGVMIYSSADLMDTPWSIIIKMYRDQLGDTCFNKLEDYVNDFVAYLKTKSFFNSEAVQHKYLHISLTNFLNEYYQRAQSDIINLQHNGLNIVLPEQVIYDKMLSLFDEIKGKNDGISDEFSDFSKEDFEKFGEKEFDDIKLQLNGKVRDLTEFIGSFSDAFYSYLISKDTINRTGIVFVGYGEDEIFPSLLSLNVDFGFAGRLKYSVVSQVRIGDGKEAEICPFAQQDVMRTILRGVDDGVQDYAINMFYQSVMQFKQEITNDLAQANVDNSVIEKIINWDVRRLVGFYGQSIEDYLSKEYVSKLYDTVAYLSKEDLANMAESLIALTSLKRRMTSSEESVGGPVDVAVISKSDGFIWIKRKHYFDRALNEHFFSRYK